MTTDQQSSEGNLYLVSVLALVFVLVSAVLAWVTLPPARRGLAAAESAGITAAEPVVETVPEAAPEAIPAQVSSGDPVAGQALYTATCAACHGPAGEGIEGLGKDMTRSEFITGLSDDELVEFIKIGRDPSDPLNTTGVAMPPKGGNPALSDEGLDDITAYLRSIQK